MAGPTRGVAQRPRRKRKMTERMRDAMLTARRRKANRESSLEDCTSEEGPPPSPKRQTTRQATPEARTDAGHSSSQARDMLRRSQSDHGASSADASRLVSRAGTPAPRVSQRTDRLGSLPTVPIAWSAGVAERPPTIAVAVCAATALWQGADGAAPAAARAAQTEPAGAPAMRDPHPEAQARDSRPCAWLTAGQWATIEQQLDDPAVTVESTAASFDLSLSDLNIRVHCQMVQPGMKGRALALAVDRAFRVKDALEQHRLRCERAGRCSGLRPASAAGAVAKPAQSPAPSPVPGHMLERAQRQPACGVDADAAAASQAQPLIVHTAVAAVASVLTASPSASAGAAVMAAPGVPRECPTAADAPGTALKTAHSQPVSVDAAAGAAAPAAAKLPAALSMLRSRRSLRASPGAVAGLAATPEQRLEGPGSLAGAGLESTHSAGGNTTAGEPGDAELPSSAAAAAAALVPGRSSSACLDAEGDPPDYVPDADEFSGELGSATRDSAASAPVSRTLPGATLRYTMDTRDCHDTGAAAAASPSTRLSGCGLSCHSQTSIRDVLGCRLCPVCLPLIAGLEHNPCGRDSSNCSQ